MKWVRSGFFFTTVAITTPYYTFMSGLLHYLGIARGLKIPSNASHTVASKWARSIMRFTPGWKIKVEGRENLPKDGKACVIVANHESATDILAMYYLGVQFRWLAKSEIFKLPFIGNSMKWAGYVPIDRTDIDSHRKALVTSAEWLKGGTPMFFFPEGTRSKTGKVKKFKRGAFKLASDCSTTVLPVCIKGAGNLLVKGTMIPHSATVYVKVLPEIGMNPDESVDEFAARVQATIEKHHASLGPNA